MRARLLVLLSAVCFGTTGTAQALGPDASSPLTVGAGRIAVGALLLVLAAAFLRRRADASSGGGRARGGRDVHSGQASVPPRAQRAEAAADRGALAAAGVGVAGYQLAFFAGVDSTGVAVGTVVALGSAPAFAGLLARVVNGERPGGRWAACTALAALGIGLLVVGGERAKVDPAGVLLALGAGASYATYTVAAKRMLSRGSAPEPVMARAFALGALLLLPVLAFGDTAWLGALDGLALVLYLGAIPTALAYVLFARGLRHLPAGEVATLTLAEPVCAALLGALVLGERPGALGVLGVAVVLAGLGALTLPARTRARAPAGPPGRFHPQAATAATPANAMETN